MRFQARKTKLIFTTASVVSVPAQCHAEVEIYACKVLTADEPTLEASGFKLNSDLMVKVQQFKSILNYFY